MIWLPEFSRRAVRGGAAPDVGVVEKYGHLDFLSAGNLLYSSHGCGWIHKLSIEFLRLFKSKFWQKSFKILEIWRNLKKIEEIWKIYQHLCTHNRGYHSGNSLLSYSRHRLIPPDEYTGRTGIEIFITLGALLSFTGVNLCSSAIWSNPGSFGAPDGAHNC